MSFKAYRGGIKAQSHSFLTSTQDISVWSLHIPAALSPGKKLGTQRTGDWLGPSAGLDVSERIIFFPLPGFETRIADPLALPLYRLRQLRSSCNWLAM